MRDAAAGVRDRAHVRRGGAYAVDEQRAGAHQPGRAQQLDLARAAHFHLDAAPHEEIREGTGGLGDERMLVGALGDVHRDRQSLGGGIARHRREERIAHRVRRMWGDADPHERVRRPPRLHRRHLRAKTRERRVGIRGIRPEHLAVRDAAHAHRAHRIEAGIGIGGVAEGGDARAQTLGDADRRGVEQVGLAQHAGARLRERAHPLEERKILEEPPHGREVEMRVRIHEPGREDRITELFIASTRRRLDSGPDPCDAVVLHDERAVLDRRCGDRNHPARMVPHTLAGTHQKMPGLGHSIVGSVPRMK